MEGIVWESVWVAVGFVAFAALVWKRLSGVINTMLDDRSSKIKADLDEHGHSVRRLLTSFTSSSGSIVKLQRRRKPS